MFEGPFSHSIVKRARQANLVEINFVNIRDFGIGKHKQVDDKPFGGGTGMVMRVDVLDKAIQKTRDPNLSKTEQQCILLDARGEKFSQSTAKKFSNLKHLILLCGHYEGVDERVRELVDQTISIGDFILTGGEIPAMLVTDATVRLIQNVLKTDATTYESFTKDKNHEIFLEYPQYTQPGIYNNSTVPDILISGNHKEIDMWKKNKAKELTRLHRPDLLKN